MRAALLIATCIVGAVALTGLASAQNAPTPAEQVNPDPTVANTTAQTTGPHPSRYEVDPGLPRHVVYRPANMDKVSDGALGVYVFGNGACSADATSSRNHLLEIASHGYIAIAPGFVPPPGYKRPAPPPPPVAGSTAPRPQPDTPTSALPEAIDWILAEAKRPGSRYYKKVNPEWVAISGFSCGGLQALNTTSTGDPRIRTLVVMNSGYYNGSPGRSTVDSDKANLAKIKVPTLYVLGGKTDIAFENGSDDYRRLAGIPVALVNTPFGHGGTYMQPHGGVAAEVVTSWLDWRLKGSKAAEARFTGPNCAWCADSRITFESKNF